MIPVTFAQANTIYNTPGELDHFVGSVHAYKGVVNGGGLDGCPVVVVAWQPSSNDLQALAAGSPIFVTVSGGLPIHGLTTSFEQAINPI